MTIERVKNAIFLRLCVNYEDAALRKWYDAALSFYDSLAVEPDKGEVEKEVSGSRDHQLPDMRQGELFILRA